MNEDSRGLLRHYKEEKFYFKSQGNVHRRKRTARRWGRAPGINPRTRRVRFREKTTFCGFSYAGLGKNPSFLAYKYNFSLSQILIENEAVQEEDNRSKLQGRSLSPQP